MGDLRRPPMPRILLVDHQIEYNNALAGLFREASYDVHCAYTGASAIDYLRYIRADLTVLNLEMQRLDGWQVLQWIRENPITSRMPVIVHSDLAQPQWDLAKQMGADEL